MNVVITTQNKTKKSIPLKRDIEEAVRTVLREKGFDINVELGLKVVTKLEIKKLNSKFRDKESATDVLSFPIYKKAPKVSTQTILLGDIAICLDVTQRNAKANNITPEQEFLTLIRHSTEHLLGYHHKE